MILQMGMQVRSQLLTALAAVWGLDGAVDKLLQRSPVLQVCCLAHSCSQSRLTLLVCCRAHGDVSQWR